MESTVLPTPTGRMARPGMIRAAAVLQSLYALAEISDCLVVLLMSLGLVANFHPKMLFQETQNLFDSQRVWLVPLFLFYTSLRVTSAIGLWRNRIWGFWLALFVSTATFIMAPLLLPYTAAEMLLNGILVAILLIGSFGEAPIITTRKG